MPINDPTITATCDTCGFESDPMELCSLAGGGWDARHIAGKLRRMGWTVKGDETTCGECSEEAEDSPRTREEMLANAELFRRVTRTAEKVEAGE